MQAQTRPFDFVLEAYAGYPVISFISCDPKDNPKFLFGSINISSLKDTGSLELQIRESIFNPQTGADNEVSNQRDNVLVEYLEAATITLNGKRGNKLSIIPLHSGKMRVSGFITDNCEFEINQPEQHVGHISTGLAPHQYPYSVQHLDESSSSSSEEFSSSSSESSSGA